MLWLTYRQHRLELSTLFFVAIALAALLSYAGIQELALRTSLGIDSCVDRLRDEACANLLRAYREQRSPLQGLFIALLALPALVAAFIGGPLFSRDFERGTHRLIWTQGITRVRWAAEKLLGFVIVAAAAAAILVAVRGFSLPLIGPGMMSPFATYDLDGPAFVAYMVFAVALGAAFSALLRRSVLAMLLSLLTFVGARFVVLTYLRPNFQPPLVWDIRGPLPTDAWDLQFRYVTADGMDVPANRVFTLMGKFSGAVAEPFQFNMNAYFAANDVFTTHLYQPADRYWLFQSIEATLFLGVAAALIALTVWLIKRRPA